MLPGDKSINKIFVIECAEYSKKIQDRKTDSFQTTIKAQLHDILSANYKHPKDINPKRFTQPAYWMQREVSNLYSGKIHSQGKIPNSILYPSFFVFCFFFF
jgi:hypothetical protein